MSSPGNYWSQLSKAAVMGTRQRTPQIRVPKELDLGNHAFGGTPEEVLLAAAGVAALARRAGQTLASPDLPPVAVAPPETQPYISSAAALRASQVFAKHQNVVPEWLAAVAASGRILSPDLLPQALDFAVRERAHRQLVLSVCGNRGAWLGTLNPAWRGMVVPPEGEWEDVWHNGTVPERLVIWEEILARNPSLARQWLNESWESEVTITRAKFLKILRGVVLPEDEPLLEKALDIRLQEVREAAREALLLIPGSGLVRRLSHETGKYLALAHRRVIPFRSSARINVSLPSKYDSLWKRDGIHETPPPHHPKYGPRAFWVQQMVQAVPPSYWTTLWQLSPEEILEAARGDWQELLWDSWLVATKRHRDPVWARCFMELALKEHLRPEPELCTILPAAEAETYASRFLHPGMSSWHDLPRLCSWLFDSPQGIASVRFSRDLLDALRREGQSSPDQILHFLKTYNIQLAVRLAPEIWSEVAQSWPPVVESQNAWPKLIRTLQNRLRFRFEMLSELQNP